jgi:glucose-1-phosphatase
MNSIRNIIFDLGGIFINIDFGRTRKAFTELGVTGFDELYTQHHASDLFQLLETGRISPAEFHQAFVQHTNVPLTYSQLVEAWNALLLDFPPERIEWLKQTGGHYRIFLFSNTNQIHHDAFQQSFRERFNEDFDNLFLKAYYSHEMGLRKPDVDSFQFILNEQRLRAEETLFVDDTPKNIEGAKKAGLSTFHVAPPGTVLDVDRVLQHSDS